MVLNVPTHRYRSKVHLFLGRFLICLISIVEFHSKHKHFPCHRFELSAVLFCLSVFNTLAEVNFFLNPSFVSVAFFLPYGRSAAHQMWTWLYIHCNLNDKWWYFVGDCPALSSAQPQMIHANWPEMFRDKRHSAMHWMLKNNHDKTMHHVYIAVANAISFKQFDWLVAFVLSFCAISILTNVVSWWFECVRELKSRMEWKKWKKWKQIRNDTHMCQSM